MSKGSNRSGRGLLARTFLAAWIGFAPVAGATPPDVTFVSDAQTCPIAENLIARLGSIGFPADDAEELLSLLRPEELETLFENPGMLRVGGQTESFDPIKDAVPYIFIIGGVIILTAALLA